MNLARTISVVCIAIGLAGVSIALGFIYMDFVKRFLTSLWPLGLASLYSFKV